MCWLQGCIWFVKMHYFSVYTYFTKKFLTIKKWNCSRFPSSLRESLPTCRGSTCLRMLLALPRTSTQLLYTHTVHPPDPASGTPTLRRCITSAL